MTYNGRTIIEAKAKVSIFVNHYFKISNPTLIREFKKGVNLLSTDDNSRTKLTKGELEYAINKMKQKGAPGPDGIPPFSVKALGPVTLQELLDIFKKSFSQADCPRTSDITVIIPILKASKSACDVASYRPISITSCIVKMLEHILAESLYYIAEE